jgi:hypothetical protein
VVLLALVAVALMWPVIGDRVQASLSPNKDGCPHAGELPAPERLAEGRAAVLCLLNRNRAQWGVRINSTPAEIVRGWMDSPGDRANILRPTFSEVGTGIGYDASEPLVEAAAVYVNNFGA